MSIENLKISDPFAEADEASGGKAGGQSPAVSKPKAKPKPENGTVTIENLKTIDPFQEDHDGRDGTKNEPGIVHIRTQQRNGRKSLTTIQGLSEKKFNPVKIMKVIRKQLACNGTVIYPFKDDKDKDNEKQEIEDKDAKKKPKPIFVLQLQGDQRVKMKAFITDKVDGLGIDEKLVKMHGA